MKPLATVCTLLFTVLLFTVAVSAYAQTPDTTSAERYFPLEVGNVWEYEVSEEGVVTRERRTVTEEEVIDGVRYFRYLSERIDRAGEPTGDRSAVYLRFDTLSATIRGAEGGGPLRAGSGVPALDRLQWHVRVRCCSRRALVSRPEGTTSPFESETTP